MSDTLESLRRKIGGAGDMESVVRSMKALAASSIGQYERSVRSLADYYRAVEMGLAVCLRKGARIEQRSRKRHGRMGAIIFGSDQGLVGQFNHALADFAASRLASLPGEKRVWVVGERMQSCLVDAGLSPTGVFAVPNSVDAITPLVGQILVECEAYRKKHYFSELYLFHNRPKGGPNYESVSQLLLPLSEVWQSGLIKLRWPTGNLPEVLGDSESSLSSLVHEYLFVSLFRACAESLASENASRLAAMQRAEKNIDELLEDLNRTFNRVRQSAIDEELFDVISGFEALTNS
jgi:F-type H+-transporting ATPase subunit gamma